MNVLFLFVSLPKVIDGNGLFDSLILEFQKNGHNVFVATKNKTNNITELKHEKGIEVLRIKSREFTGVSSNIKKALGYQEYTIKQTILIKKYFKNKKIDLIISHSLPPELALEIFALKKIFKCKFYLLQTDYTWQDAVAYGYFKKNGPIGLYYRFWERCLFKLADFIGCPSYGNIDFIKKEYPWLSNTKFKVIDFWSNSMNVKSICNVRKKYGIENKFVAIYGGSVGVAQRIEHLIDLAYSCKDEKEIIFLILGKGTQLENIKNLVKKRELENVMFIPFLPHEDYIKLLSSCDAGFVVLNEKLATPNFPSKTLLYFNLQIPILAAIDYVTDYGKFLEKTGTGLWSYTGDVENIKKNLLKLYTDSNLCARIKENQIRYFNDNMQPKNAYQTIINHINDDKK